MCCLWARGQGGRNTGGEEGFAVFLPLTVYSWWTFAPLTFCCKHLLVLFFNLWHFYVEALFKFNILSDTFVDGSLKIVILTALKNFEENILTKKNWTGSQIQLRKIGQPHRLGKKILHIFTTTHRLGTEHQQERLHHLVHSSDVKSITLHYRAMHYTALSNIVTFHYIIVYCNAAIGL